MNFASALAKAQRRLDRELPADDRSDDQIEQDAADRMERDQLAVRMAVPRNDAVWDLLTITRGMK